MEPNSTDLPAHVVIQASIVSSMRQWRSSPLMMLRAKVSLQQMAMTWEVGRGERCGRGLERKWNVATVEGLGRP